MLDAHTLGVVIHRFDMGLACVIRPQVVQCIGSLRNFGPINLSTFPHFVRVVLLRILVDRQDDSVLS